MAKTDPYAALRFKEFRIFLLVRFVLVFGWTMQFVVIEWEVYSLTKDPLSLGFIGLMEIIPALSMALFAGHIVDQREKRNLLATCIALFSIISLGLFLLTWDPVVGDWSTKKILYCVYALIFFGGFLRSFFGPTIFSLLALIVPKKNISKCGNMEQFYLANGCGCRTGFWWIFYKLVRSALGFMYRFWHGIFIVFNFATDQAQTHFESENRGTGFREFKRRRAFCV